MNPRLLQIFQRQVLIQCEYMMEAAAEIERAMSKQDVSGIKAVFYGLQNLLNAAANVSKTLWGSGGKYQTERKALRDSIGISDASPVREVTMRNNFEHYDERLDKWWAESKRHNYADMNIGPASSIPFIIDEIDLFRHFDPTTTDAVFWGQFCSFSSSVVIVDQ